MGRDQELIEAARGGNYPVVERILSTKPKKPGPFASLRRTQGGISTRDSCGYTALHYAALNNHKEVVKLLLSYEASCNSVDGAGSSPLHLAAWAGHTEVVYILLNTGPSIPNVNLTNGDKETALHCAAHYGHLEAVRLLLEAGAEPNIKNSKEETALDLAAQYGRNETVGILLETHPEMVGKFTAYGSMVYLHTPLHLASRNGHKNVIEQLIKVGIDINVRTSRGSALHEAALCGKVEVVRVLLDHGINTNLRDQSDQTVLDVMAELQTQRTKEITRIILDYNSARGNIPHSPYDNVSLTHSLESSTSLESPRPRATTWQASRDRRTASSVEDMESGGSTSWQVRERRTAASVEELDKRISSFSSTSGFSDCTTSTLQGARSYDSNFLSESEVTITGTLTRGDDTSISSASSTSSLSPICVVRPGSSVSQNTLTKPDKPKLPAKPAHIRPGLKPVQIPNVDDKLGLKPKKPPRRNLSISPVRNSSWEAENAERCKKSTKGVYSSKSGSKSFDELDDIICDKAKKQSGHKRNRRTLSSVSSSDVFRDKENHQTHHIPVETRHSCDEILTEAFLPPAGQHGGGDCQRCVLNSISNRSLNLDCDGDHGQTRFISQRQYKRKIRRDGPSTTLKYSTLDPKTERKIGGKSSTAVLVSKTTFKLRKNQFDSDLDSAGEDNGELANDLELMEIPLSPTHYNQPSTPDHDPPTPWEAESAIHSVLSFLKSEYQPASKTTSTLTEPWMLLSLDTSTWPAQPQHVEDKSTCTQMDRKVPSGRKLPAIPKEEAIHLHIATSPESDDSSVGEVVLRKKPNEESIYQSIEFEKGSDSDSNRVSLSSDKSQSLSILSPFDEQEEWSKISQIIDSFGADIGKQTESSCRDANTPNNSPVYDYPTLKKREKLTSTIEEWLSFINMENYIRKFEENGYDNINYIGGSLMTKDDLLEIGITDPKDISVLIESLKHRDNKFRFDDAGEPVDRHSDLEQWLKSIDLVQYVDNFRNNLLVDMDRIRGVWDDELSSIVEIEKIGHRKRILLSVAGSKGLKERIGKVQASTELDRSQMDASNEHRNKQVKKASQPEMKTRSYTQEQTSKFRGTDSPSREESKTRAEIGSTEEKHKAKQSPKSKVKRPAAEPTKQENQLLKRKSEERIGQRASKDDRAQQQPQQHRSEVPLCSLHSAQRRKTSGSSTSESSERVEKPAVSTVKRPSIESGTLTLGRRKKRAPQPPVPAGDISPKMKLRQQPASFKSHEVQGRMNVDPGKDLDEGVSFKVMYHGNTLLDQFNSLQSTKDAIDKVKKSRDIIKKTGMPTVLVINATEIITTIFDGQEVLQNHRLSNITCLVQDSENPCIFGFITTDITNMQRFSHVYSAESKEIALQILPMVSREFREGFKLKETSPSSSSIPVSDTKPAVHTKPKGLGVHVTNSKSRSDHLVTRMKNFFQGGDTGKGSLGRDGGRRRGGSMDNLIDSVGEEISTNTRKKCSSIKNLSCIGPKAKNEVKITSV